MGSCWWGLLLALGLVWAASVEGGVLTIQVSSDANSLEDENFFYRISSSTENFVGKAVASFPPGSWDFPVVNRNLCSGELENCPLTAVSQTELYFFFFFFFFFPFFCFLFFLFFVFYCCSSVMTFVCITL